MYQLTAAFITVAVIMGIKQGYSLHIEASELPSIFILGIFNTGIGCLLYFSSIKNLPTQTVAVCGYAEPLSAVIFSVILLHEHISLIQTLGICMVILGAAIAEKSRDAE